MLSNSMHVVTACRRQSATSQENEAEGEHGQAERRKPKAKGQNRPAEHQPPSEAACALRHTPG